MKKQALVTGASSGIGRDLSIEHAKRGGDLIIVARRKDRLDELKKELEKKYSVQVHAVESDLTKEGSGRALFEECQKHDRGVDILINNAGFGLHGHFSRQQWEPLQSMIRLNVEALTELSHLFLPDMIKRKSGAILNVASIAGFLPGPQQAVYYATKAYVLSLSEALAKECEGTGVKVTALCPGFTKTEFFEKADLDDVAATKFPAMTSEEVAAYGYKAMERGKPVAVPGLINRFLAHFLIKFSPRFLNTAISNQFMRKK